MDILSHQMERQSRVYLLDVWHQLPCGVISKGSLGWTHPVPIEPQIVFAEAVSFIFLVLLDTSYWLFPHLP